MTPLLVCAATEFELACFPEREGVVRATTGVGIAQTLVKLPPLLALHRPERVLNIGIAGAYEGCGLSIGDIVAVAEEVFGDVGFEQPDSGFVPIQESAFGAGYEEIALRCDGPGVRGCTVNTCTGTPETGARRRDLFGAQIETMEGAAVALACRAAGISISQVRAISNIAATRDMRPENIGLALERLKAALM